jgi:hypothetical protein
MTVLLHQIIQILDGAGISKLSRADFISKLQEFMTSRSPASEFTLPSSNLLIWAKVFALLGQYFEQAEPEPDKGQPHNATKNVPSHEELVSFPMTESEWELIQKMREIKKHHNPDSDSDCLVVFVSDRP